MYTSPDDARSDLFLSAAVFLFGPLLLGVVLRIIPLNRIGLLQPVLAVAVPLVITVLVPYLLMRYRGESFSMYGLGSDESPALALGALFGLPIAAAFVLAIVLSGVGPDAALPVAVVGEEGGFVELLRRLATWLGVALLGVYATVKARDAFRADYRTIRDGVWEIGRVVGIVAAVATLLLLVGLGLTWQTLLPPLGVALSVYLLFRSLRGPSSTSRAVLLTPVILLALGAFRLTFRADQLVVGVWSAALVAGVGLIIGALVESRRSAFGPIGLGLVIALLSTMSPGF